MRVVPVPVRQDNYAYLIIDEPSATAVAVDPFDVSKVAAAAEKEQVKVTGAITTHHHADHSGGNQAFAAKYPGTPVYGGSDAIPALTNLVKDGDQFKIGNNIDVKCLATPCHTQDSISFFISDSQKPDQKGVFTGDTLFQAGCGRFFEGTASQMRSSLKYLASLPKDTVVYNGHEYTPSSVKFAISVDPDNAALQKLKELSDANPVTTGKTTIGDELEYNPFMRLTDPVILKATGTTDEVETMDKLRTMKNNFRG
ncbi:Metallo-hydrolase/oxidoreductase [Sistotremastrum niveocremeum HHB9708]|uniref:hydroxyacylglutathione hydrolase n=2 Tax=Sistotremastraceae TaxID=3402574 RepID=A0A165AKD2_9AGAM|nr:Metallo-hydrolase/oxidoreductase [Sistotremastrum niveocremeum HHB9708]KZT43959.1 hydroxyacylglutathione hydrolase [Sistotremastrum suecicum HHB10207 ss-3]